MKEFDRLIEIVTTLRAPDGCPWDRDQTLYSLKDKMIEEAYELLDAIDNKDIDNIHEELGDLTLHIVMHSLIAEEENLFTMKDVLNRISDKMVRRHPHVFGDEDISKTEDVIKRWDEIKKIEKKGKEKESNSILDNVPVSLPSLLKSAKMQKIASKVGFDWKNINDVIEKLEEEIAELKSAIKNNDKENIEEEIGDILFTTINISNHLKISPDNALRQTNNKFYKRFNYIEKHLQSIGKSFEECTLDELEEIYQIGKKELKSKE